MRWIIGRLTRRGFAVGQGRGWGWCGAAVVQPLKAQTMFVRSHSLWEFKKDEENNMQTLETFIMAL